MNKRLLFMFFIVIAGCSFGGGQITQIPKIKEIKEAVELFPNNCADIRKITDSATIEAQRALSKIFSVPENERTFENIVKALDYAETKFSIAVAIVEILQMLSPSEPIRETARQSIAILNNFLVDNFSQNSKLYTLIKDYSEKVDLSSLNLEERNTLKNMKDQFLRDGLHLDKEKQDEIKKIKKELSERSTNFNSNIASDNRTIKKNLEDLDGLSQEWIKNLKKDSDGKFIIGVDYPTFTYVMENAKVESTRKDLWLEFVNRGYPHNEEELNEIISLRDRLATLVGFESFSDLDIDSQMAQTVKKVEDFLNDLVNRCQKKVNIEVEKFKADLPESITLTQDKKFKPWDMAYIKNQYKKKNLQVDEQLISEYFPIEHTISALFDIYQKFFGLEFKKEPVTGLWHPEVEALSVYKNNRFIGYIFLDLFPRDNKYSHAAEVTILPTFKPNANEFYPAVILVMANFARASADKPSLLTRNEVTTFFHEFGHAIHAILGASELGSNSGTSVKRDFVEMPSQMLEEWMWQPKFLRIVSSHYKTHKPLPEELIEKIVALKNFNSGEENQKQILYSFLALDLFKKGENKNVKEIFKNLYQKYIKHVEFSPENNFYASFGHLTEYAAKYYGYLWSKVYALDLFDKIKKADFSPEIGQKYIDTILSKGASEDPMKLLKDFLGRAPNSQAFFKDLGIEI